MDPGLRLAVEAKALEFAGVLEAPAPESLGKRANQWTDDEKLKLKRALEWASGGKEWRNAENKYKQMLRKVCELFFPEMSVKKALTQSIAAFRTGQGIAEDCEEVYNFVHDARGDIN